MLEDFLREVVVTVVGKNAEEIAKLLNTKKHVNEFLIAKKLDLTINQTRNILYKIADQGLVSSIRKKDKKKGWYTYFWKIEIIKSLEFLRTILSNKIQQLERQVQSRETKEFYECKNCGIEFNEENALLHNFTCNECGRVFIKKDNTKILRNFKRELDKLKKELFAVNEEMDKENVKVDKIKAKQLKKDLEEKAAKRKEAARKRAATRKKTAAAKAKLEKSLPKSKKKKLVKKSTKKKSVKKKPVKKKISQKKPIKKKPVKKVIKKKKFLKKKR